jgi:hypothetical protein
MSSTVSVTGWIGDRGGVDEVRSETVQHDDEEEGQPEVRKKTAGSRAHSNPTHANESGHAGMGGNFAQSK